MFKKATRLYDTTTAPQQVREMKQIAAEDLKTRRQRREQIKIDSTHKNIKFCETATM
jgi:hypothetical protein